VTFAFALTIALALCYFLVQMPLQISDDSSGDGSSS
jgi:hypothetical protein